MRMLALLLLLAAGCAAPAVTPTPRTEPARTVVPARDPLAAPWTVSRDAGAFTHRMALASVLISRVDSAEAVDTLHATLETSWTRLAGGEPARLSGLLTAYSLTRGASDTASTPAGLLLPLPFAALDARGAQQARFEIPAAGPCAPSLAVGQPLRELFLAPPSRLEVGTTWEDSATYGICRDSIPLEVRSVRRYRVTGAERRGEALVVLVDRESRVTMTGEGIQFGETIAIRAEGTGRLRFALRAVGAVMLDGEGESTLQMQMRGRRRSQDLTQRTRIVISTP